MAKQKNSDNIIILSVAGVLIVGGIIFYAQTRVVSAALLGAGIGIVFANLFNKKSKK